MRHGGAILLLSAALLLMILPQIGHRQQLLQLLFQKTAAIDGRLRREGRELGSADGGLMMVLLLTVVDDQLQRS